MCVLQPGERQMLAAAPGAQLQNDGPTCQFGLRGQKDPTMRSAAEFGEQVEVADLLPRLRKSELRQSIPQRSLAIEKNAHLSLPAREATDQILVVDQLVVLGAKREFFCDQFEGRFGLIPKARLVIEILFHERSFAVSPAFDEIGDEVVEYRRGRSRIDERPNSGTGSNKALM